MTDTYNQLKKELSVLYPDVTDDEVRRFITFFKLSAKAVFEAKKAKRNPPIVWLYQILLMGLNTLIRKSVINQERLKEQILQKLPRLTVEMKLSKLKRC